MSLWLMHLDRVLTRIGVCLMPAPIAVPIYLEERDRWDNALKSLTDEKPHPDGERTH
ncbi:hypothetical protein [Kineosporia babensis]|uniref:Uncharacterized protein n=1 Tax=Kineosporia babensis TaxID=499548 RepID=A0A9X1NHI7_9ACTN|nr:hypothetical protein [Kineosporia babensis]MCD5315182.1 hypothetical protein [Kineosporia babensis]